ncbi:MAG: hypothetical protein AB2L20_09560 [Mangrovibacterium sp.]
MMNFTAIDRQIGEHPGSFNEFAIMWLKYPKVFPGTDTISDMIIIQISDPFLSDKFSVGCQTIQCLCPEQPDKPLDQLDAFISM